MLTLAIGDFHIPERATELPVKFHKLLSSSASANKIQKTVCLGNVTSSLSTLEFVKNISSDFELIKGEFDNDLSIPTSCTFRVESFKIGVISGYTVIPQNDPLSLLTHARMMDVDILIWGGSSKVEAYTLDGKFFINPGSATGAMSFNQLEKEDLEFIANEFADDNASSHSDEGKQNETKADNEEESKRAESNGKSNAEDDDNKESSSVQQKDTHKPTSASAPIDKEKLLEELISPVPSFCLLDIKGSLCVTYIYTLIDNEIKIDKINYRKE